MIHSLFVTRNSARGELVFERWYAPAAALERDAYLSALYAGTKATWGSVVQQVALVAECIVVYAQLGDLMFFLSGTGEYDELILSEVLQSLCDLTVAVCAKGRTFSENELLLHYASFVQYVDHAIRHGQLEHLDKDLLSALVNQVPPTPPMVDKTELQTISCPGFSKATPRAAAVRTARGALGAPGSPSADRSRSESHVAVGK